MAGHVPDRSSDRDPGSDPDPGSEPGSGSDRDPGSGREPGSGSGRDPGIEPGSGPMAAIDTMVRRVGAGAAAVALLALTVWAFAPAGEVEAGPAGVRVDPDGVYNPVLAGERLPDGFRQVLPRDAIAPVYDPVFVAGVDAGWPDDAQVIGVRIGDESKAYPVSFLNGREMVVDEIDGIPILVTW